MHDWFVWCKLKKRAEEMRSFELSGKKIFFKYDETRSKEKKNKKNWGKKNAHSGQSVRYKSWWKRGNIKIAVSEDHASCWVHKDLTVTTKQIHSSEGVGRKGRMSNTTDRYRAGILEGHRNRQIRRLQLPRHSYSG